MVNLARETIGVGYLRSVFNLWSGPVFMHYQISHERQ